MGVLKSCDQCGYCKRTEIEVLRVAEWVEFDDAPDIWISTSRICEDCFTVLRYSIRIGGLALRNELSRQRQLDLFEAPKDRVIRLMERMGKDAPNE